MRIRFTFAGGSGHMEPLVPIACAPQLLGIPLPLLAGHNTLKRKS